MDQSDLEEESAPRSTAKNAVWRWMYDNAITGLAAIAFGAWAFNVKDAKEAYVSGQRIQSELTKQVLTNQDSIMDNQHDMQRTVDLIKDRQDRNNATILDHEMRLRRVENHYGLENP